MANVKVTPDNFADAVVKALKDYANVTAQSVNEASDSVSKEAVKMLKAKSPRKKGGNGEYAKGWSRKADKKGATNSYTLYNKNKPQLTHLLEKGHAVKPDPKHPNRKKRVEGIEHIGPVDDWVAVEMLRRGEKKL